MNFMETCLFALIFHFSVRSMISKSFQIFFFNSLLSITPTHQIFGFCCSRFCAVRSCVSKGSETNISHANEVEKYMVGDFGTELNKQVAIFTRKYIFKSDLHTVFNECTQTKMCVCVFEQPLG